MLSPRVTVTLVLLGALLPRPADAQRLSAPLDVGEIQSLKFSPDGRLLVAVGATGVTVLESQRLTRIASSPSLTPVRRLPPAFGDDSGKMAVADNATRAIWLFDAATREWSHLPVTMDDRPSALAFDETGSWLAVGDESGHTSVWDLDEQREVFTVRTTEHVHALALVRRDSLVVSGEGYQAVRFWNVYTGAKLVEYREDVGILSLTRHPFAPILVSTSGHSTSAYVVRLWELRPISSRAALPASSPPLGVQFSHDGELMAVDQSGGAYKGVAVWLLSPLEKVAEISGARLALLGFAQHSHDLYTHLNSISGQGGPSDLDVIQLHTAGDYAAAKTIVVGSPGDFFLQLAYSPERSAMAFAYSEEDEVHLVELAGVSVGPEFADSTSTPRRLSLDAAVPNPFIRWTTARFHLTEHGSYSVVVYDVLGRPVRSLASGVSAPGVGTLTWDGMDDQGTEMPAGVYICQLRTQRGSRSTKMTKLREN